MRVEKRLLKQFLRTVISLDPTRQSFTTPLVNLKNRIAIVDGALE